VIAATGLRACADGSGRSRASAGRGDLGGSSPRTGTSQGGLGGSSPRAGTSRGGLGGSSPRAGTGRVAVLGIRHHGPGSARSVVAELDRLQPAVVLIEGPADAGEVLALAADPGMVPPVALLAYAPDEPRRSAFWPFAVFSPEWQALAWAAAHRVPARFCDLPASAMLAEDETGAAEEADSEEEPAQAGPRDGEPGQGRPDTVTQRGEPGQGDADAVTPHGDPVALLAAAAGYDDPERWWDQVIESRLDGQSPFAALTDAMAELRADAGTMSYRAERRGEELREQRREAHMRQAVRAALRETDGTVAVVCGAWHAPALSGKLPPASGDAELLRGLPRRKATLTWVPWTHSRLAAASGYGAGITSPGWYHHLFTTPEQTVVRWLTKVAGVLREHDLPVSTAHIIEAARLAEALAALRARPLAGLAEVGEATKSVMCDGDDVAAAFVTRDLVVGELLGAVPDATPAVPLDADLRAQARAVHLKIEGLDRTLALDLRKETDRGRSVLLHRLALLGIGWGAVTEDRVRGTGTFHETWTLAWRPELAVAVIDAARWGTTVVTAATAKIIDDAAAAAELAEVTAAVEQVLLADLADGLTPVLRALDARAAAANDVAQLMAAVPPLARAVRYGDVRGTDTAALSAVIDAITARVCAGLPAAVTSLADDAAAQLRAAVDGMHAALALHAQDDRGRVAYELWVAALTALAGRRDVHGLLAGRVVRVLTDTGVLSREESARRLAAQLSIGIPAPAKAAWAEGFLSGGGLVLVHDRQLLTVLDDWVATLPGDDFTDVLPLLRRTFSEYTAPERANIAAAVRNLSGGGSAAAEPGEPLDAARAAGALRTVAAILGGTQ
jgi:hypothetical protein